MSVCFIVALFRISWMVNVVAHLMAQMAIFFTYAQTVSFSI